MMYSQPDSVKMAWEGFTYYDNWAEHIGKVDSSELARFRRCGGLVTRSAASEAYLQSVLAAYDEVGLEYEEWDLNTLESRGFDGRSFHPARRVDDEEFGASSDSLCGAVFFPLCGYVSDPALAARNVHDAAVATGRSAFAFGANVTAITRDAAGRVAGVRLADGSSVSCPVVINAAGPGSSHVTRLAFPDEAERAREMRVDTRPFRTEVAYAKGHGARWSTGGADDLVVCDLDTGVYMRPEGARGEKMLIGSVDPPCDVPHHCYPDDAESVYPGGEESPLTEQWTNQVYRAALRLPSLPLPHASATQGFSAAYDVTPDWVPIYDHSRGLPGYFMAIGTSGNQFKCAGVAARLMAELVEAAATGRDLDAQPLMLPLPRIGGGHAISSATFSRLRDPLRTTGTVVG